MKTVYEEGELEGLKEADEELRKKGRFALFDDSDPDRVYALTFKVTKPWLAEYLLVGLLHNQLDNFDLGIDIQSIDFSRLVNSDDVKKKLHKAIDDIIG